MAPKRKMLTGTSIRNVTDYRILTQGFKVGGVNGHAASNGKAWVTALLAV